MVDTSSKHFNINVFIIIYASLFGMLCEASSRFFGVSEQTSETTRTTSQGSAERLLQFSRSMTEESNKSMTHEKPFRAVGVLSSPTVDFTERIA
jgi:hypothetical protein